MAETSTVLRWARLYLVGSVIVWVAIWLGTAVVSRGQPGVFGAMVPTLAVGTVLGLGLPPTPTRVNQPGNHAPQFPSPLRTSKSTESQYDSNGRLVGAVTTITVLSPATDADGDTITYSWSSSNGSIIGNGLIGTWNRVLANGKVQGGTATITASDGKGGIAKVDFVVP